jgi:hypothetical protein
MRRRLQQAALPALLASVAALGAACGGEAGNDDGEMFSTTVAATQVRSADIGPCLDLWNRTAPPEAHELMATVEGDVRVWASRVTWEPETVRWGCWVAGVDADGQVIAYDGDEDWYGKGLTDWTWVGGPPVGPADPMPPGTARPRADGTLVAT